PDAQPVLIRSDAQTTVHRGSSGNVSVCRWAGDMTEPEKHPRMNGSDEPAEMSSPHAIEARASRVRQIVAGVAAVLVLASVPAVGLSRFASANEDVLNDTKQDLQHSKDELQKAQDKYS